jgi:hypothetical protein
MFSYVFCRGAGWCAALGIFMLLLSASTLAAQITPNILLKITDSFHAMPPRSHEGFGELGTSDGYCLALSGRTICG